MKRKHFEFGIIRILCSHTISVNCDKSFSVQGALQIARNVESASHLQNDITELRWSHFIANINHYKNIFAPLENSMHSCRNQYWHIRPKNSQRFVIAIVVHATGIGQGCSFSSTLRSRFYSVSSGRPLEQLTSWNGEDERSAYARRQRARARERERETASDKKCAVCI